MLSNLSDFLRNSGSSTMACMAISVIHWIIAVNVVFEMLTSEISGGAFFAESKPASFAGELD